MEGPGDGSVYGAFISRQLDDQRGLKESLERRAAGVITTSGVLVTLLFGLTEITTRVTSFALPNSAHTPLLVALGAFVVAFAFSVSVTIPFRYRAVTPRGLEEVRREKWDSQDSVARRRVAGTEIVLIESYRRANRVKAWLLVCAGVAQLTALVALGVTAWTILEHTPTSHGAKGAMTLTVRVITSD